MTSALSSSASQPERQPVQPAPQRRIDATAQAPEVAISSVTVGALSEDDRRLAWILVRTVEC